MRITQFLKEDRIHKQCVKKHQLNKEACKKFNNNKAEPNQKKRKRG